MKRYYLIMMLALWTYGEEIDDNINNHPYLAPYEETRISVISFYNSII